MTKRRWLKSAIEEAKKSDPHMPWTRPVQTELKVAATQASLKPVRGATV